MTVFTLILLICILVLVLTMKSDLSGKIQEMDYKIDRLLKQQETVAPKTKDESTPQRDWDRQLTPRPEPPPYIPPAPVTPVVPAPPVAPVIPEPPIIEPVIPAPLPVESYTPPQAEPAREAAFTPIEWPDEEPVAAQQAPVHDFWEKNPDLEKFIGENLFNKIGIAILVIGIGFFLKYAIDKNWINEVGRTFIGILCGGILIGVAHRMRKTFTAFSSVLVGGGVAVLYFSITIAFQQYHLVSQTLAFVMMLIITAFTVVLSLSYNRKELAILAILGGFSSPLLISTGAGNAVVLFTYILILNVGMLVLAYYKKWNIVNVICYIATILLFGSWLSYSISQESTKPVPYGTALIFATLFYIVFFLMNVINNLRQRVSFKAGEILILLSNTFLYYAAGMVILAHIQAGIYQGLFTASIAVFNFVFAYSLYRQQHADKNLIYLLIGLTLSFLSLAAPVQLEGNHITLFWAAESVLLLWLYQRSRIVLMQYASALVFGMMSISLLLDWWQVYGQHRYTVGITHMWPLLNQGFMTGIVCIAALFILRRLLKKDLDQQYFFGLPVTNLRYLLGVLSVIVVYVVGVLELYYQVNIYWPAITHVSTGIYNYLFICVLLFLSRKEHIVLRIISLMLAAIFVLVFIVLYNEEIIDLRAAYLEEQKSLGHFLLSYLLNVTLLIMLYQAYLTLKSFGKKEYNHAFQWTATFTLLYVLSASLDHVVVLSTYQHNVSTTAMTDASQRTGYTILWAAFAFVLIYLGFKWQSKQIRIIAISLFALTLLKLFLYDLHDLSEGGKIAAFISLGIILLIISFMYQRLKKILLTDENQTAN